MEVKRIVRIIWKPRHTLYEFELFGGLLGFSFDRDYKHYTLFWFTKSIPNDK